MKTSMTKIVHWLLTHKTSKDSIMIDTTMGNGFNTLFLASFVKFVYAFDIQEVSFTNTKDKLLTFNNCQSILDSHENILNHMVSLLLLFILNTKSNKWKVNS